MLASFCAVAEEFLAIYTLHLAVINGQPHVAMPMLILCSATWVPKRALMPYRGQDVARSAGVRVGLEAEFRMNAGGRWLTRCC